MMKKIVLFFPKLEPGKPWHWFPMGVLSTAGPLLAEGFEVVIIDERVTPDYDGLLKSYLGENCLLVGISAFTGYQLTCALTFAKKVRSVDPRVKLVWGGPHVTALPKESTQSPYVDACLEGYGEWSFTELCKKLRAGQHPGLINGVYWKEKNGEITSVPAKSDLHFLDNAPPMPYHLIDVPKYINPETKSVAYMTSYGCPSRCAFCHTPTRRWTRFSFDKVRTDLELLVARNQLERLVIYDATFFVDEEFCLEFINWQIEKRPFQIWICDGRAIDVERLDDKTLELAVKSGLKSIIIGLESGSERVSKLHKKGHDHVRRYRRVIERLKDYDIEIISGVIFGTPTETVDELKESLNFLLETSQINPRLRFSTTNLGALPGTELYHLIKKLRGDIFPKTLEEWAADGENRHYFYNSYMPKLPWIEPDIVDEYKRVYEAFWRKNDTLWC